MTPQSLLLPASCPACDRPARELSPCPWCGESVPAASATRGDLVRMVAGLALLALGTFWTRGILGALGTGLAKIAVCFLSGFFLLRGAGAVDRLRAFGVAVRCSVLLAAFLALFLRLFFVPFPLRPVAGAAWLFPSLVAAWLALRIPAEAPNAALSGDPPRVRALRRHAPDLLAALAVAPFAVSFAFAEPSPLALLGLALVLGVLFSRLRRPEAPLLIAVALVSLLLPDPAAFAFGLLGAQITPIRAAR